MKTKSEKAYMTLGKGIFPLSLLVYFLLPEDLVEEAKESWDIISHLLPLGVLLFLYTLREAGILNWIEL